MFRVAPQYGYGSELVRNQRAFTKDDVLQAKLLFRVLFIVAFVAIMSLFYIWSRVQVVQYGYEINSLQNKKYELLEENRKLETEVMTLMAPQRLEALAKSQLGLIYPEAKQLRSLP